MTETLTKTSVTTEVITVSNATLTVSNATIKGDDNVIYGSENTVIGNNNTVYGDFNTVEGCLANISGDNNIVTASKQGIINGMGDGTFAPKATVTRAQAAKVIYGLMNLVGGGK